MGAPAALYASARASGCSSRSRKFCAAGESERSAWNSSETSRLMTGLTTGFTKSPGNILEIGSLESLNVPRSDRH